MRKFASVTEALSRFFRWVLGTRLIIAMHSDVEVCNLYQTVITIHYQTTCLWLHYYYHVAIS